MAKANIKVKEWFGNAKNKEYLPQLIGQKVVDVRHFYEGPFSEGWLITFSSGLILSARDGEYGDDAFTIIDLEEQERLLPYIRR